MVEVKMQITEEYLMLSMSGHAGQGEPGHDLVCAAASYQAQTLCAWAKIKELDVACEQESGRTDLIIKRTPEAFEVFHAAEIGFALLEAAYTGYIEFSIT